MRIRSILLGLLFCGISTAAIPMPDIFHFALTKSSPAADSAVPSPNEVRLWFTQAPQQNSVAVRLVNPAGELVDTSDPSLDQADQKVVSVNVDGALGAGGYTVSWRGIGDDGHVVRGEFGFTVNAQ